MKPFAQTRAECAPTSKVRLERIWLKRDGKLVCAFVKIPDNGAEARA